MAPFRLHDIPTSLNHSKLCGFIQSDLSKANALAKIGFNFTYGRRKVPEAHDIAMLFYDLNSLLDLIQQQFNALITWIDELSQDNKDCN